MTKRHFIVLLIISVVLLSIGTHFSSSETSSSNTLYLKERNQLIENYISYLATANNFSIKHIAPEFNIFYAGMGTNPISSAITLDEAETLGLLNPDVLTNTNSTTKTTNDYSIAQQQNLLVLEKFGADAWTNVEYTLSYRPPVDGTLGYREINSGKIISEERYDSLLKKYWESVAKKEDVDYYDLFLRDNELPESMSQKREDIINKYIDDIPVEMTLVSDTEETYIVNLSFNGQTESEDGLCNFYFVIDNRTGEWEIFEGLTWTEPVPEYPSGD